MNLSIRIGTALALAAFAAGCTSIKDHRGYIADAALTDAIHPGIDNKQSVEGALGRPTYISQFGQPTWYYISSTTFQKPFTRPRIGEHSVLAVKFDAAGNVIATERTGMEKIARIDPDGHATPTLGKERSFLEDLFGNIGQVGSFSGGADSGAGPNGS